METEILVYSPEKQGEVEGLFKACLDALGWGYDPAGRHADMRDIPGVYMKTGCFWCLYECGVLLGITAVRLIDADNKVAELKRMYVLPEAQGRGHGKRLLETALAFCREKGFSKIRLDTRRDRVAAVALYRKHGFVEIPSYNENPYAELYFEKLINF